MCDDHYLPRLSLLSEDCLGVQLVILITLAIPNYISLQNPCSLSYSHSRGAGDSPLNRQNFANLASICKRGYIQFFALCLQAAP